MENNIGAITTMNTGLQGAAREKYWSEITADEKIERMRHQIKRLQDSVEELENALQIMRKTFLWHDHKDGRIVNEFESHHNRLVDKRYNGDDCYF